MQKEDLKNTIAQRIKTARKNAGKSQEAIAAILKKRRDTVSRWERGFIPDSIIELRNFIEITGANPYDILDL